MKTITYNTKEFELPYLYDANKKTDILLLEKFGFFCDVPLAETRLVTGTEGELLDHTLTMLRMSSKANAVSKLHYQTLRKMWGGFNNLCNIIPITNAQNFTFWADTKMYSALNNNNDNALSKQKRHRNKRLFEEVAEQAGEIYDEKIFKPTVLSLLVMN